MKRSTKLKIFRKAPKLFRHWLGRRFGWDFDKPESRFELGHWHMNYPPYVIYEDE